MAKDLARKLGCKKNELNPILYGNSDKFTVDSEFRSRLKGKETGDRWVDCDSFEVALQNSNGDLEDGTSIIFVLPEGCSFLLDVLARLCPSESNPDYQSK